MAISWTRARSSETIQRPSHDSEEALLEKQVEDFEVPLAFSRRSKISYLWIVLQACTLGTSIILFLISGNRFSERNAAFKRISTYSPLLERVDFPTTNVQFNGTLWEGDSPSIWRKLEGEDVEAAWEQFETIRTMPMTREELIKVGKDPAKTAKFEDWYWGMGDDAYIATPDFFHQIHCLNTLRQESLVNYKKAGQIIPKHPNIHWVHIAHCVDMLMQNLLCTADTGMMTYTYMRGNPDPWPDMSVNRQCKDWTKLLEYRDTHAVDLDKYIAYPRPTGVYEIIPPPEPDP